MAREHYLQAVLTCAPLNGTAASVVSQKGCSTDSELSRAELVELINRLSRKQRLLKMVLRIDTKAKHANLVYKFNKGKRTYRFRDDPRSVVEYVHVGREIQRLILELAARNKKAKAEPATKTSDGD